MTQFIVDGIPLDVENLSIDKETGDIDGWDLFIGGIKITDSCDFLADWVVKDLERQVMKHYLEEAAIMEADAKIEAYLDRVSA